MASPGSLRVTKQRAIDLSSRPCRHPSPSLSVLIVTYDSAGARRARLPAIVAELRDGDELIVCDNGSTDATVAVVGELAPAATRDRGGGEPRLRRRLQPRRRRRERRAAAPAQPRQRRRARLPRRDRAAARRGPRLGRLAGAHHRSAGERPSTPTATRSTSPASPGPAAPGSPSRPRPALHARSPSPPAPASRSGARRWEQLGGFSSDYFLYHEDTDLGLRLWLAGYRIGIEPRALSEHDYEFGKGAQKWRYLERNRWATIIRDYPRRLLLAVLPGAARRRSSRCSSSRRSAAGCRRSCAPTREVLAWLPRLLRERREIQANAAIDARTIRRAPAPGSGQRVPGPRGQLPSPEPRPPRLLASGPPTPLTSAGGLREAGECRKPPSRSGPWPRP